MSTFLIVISGLLVLHMLYGFLLYKRKSFSFFVFLYDHYSPVRIPMVVSDVWVSVLVFGLKSHLDTAHAGPAAELIRHLLIMATFILIKVLTYYAAKGLNVMMTK